MTEKAVPKTYCSSKDDCVAFNPEDKECQRDNGCFTKENVEAYLEHCRRGIEAELRRKEE